jgi:hypothetical protein
MLAEPVFKSSCIKNLTPRPRHVDAATKLEEPLRYRADFAGMLFTLFELPRVEHRHAGVEQDRTDQLGYFDFGNAARVAADGVEIVVWHKVREAFGIPTRWRDDNWWVRQLF